LSAFEHDVPALVHGILDELHDTPARAGDLELLALGHVDRRFLVDGDLRMQRRGPSRPIGSRTKMLAAPTQWPSPALPGLVELEPHRSARFPT
jgi:hypothetical protein